MAEQEKQILSKFEWFLLIVALGILALVVLQNQGIHPVETVESTEISKTDERTRYKDSTPFGTKKDNKERLNSLVDYFGKNRAAAKAEGKDTGFQWSSLKISKDEETYLKNKYGEPTQEEPSKDWLSAISDSYNTYKNVKSAFEELGIDADKIINVENASKALSNPIIANSVVEKIEQDFGIPAEKSKAFATKNQHDLEKWASFVEQEIKE